MKDDPTARAREALKIALNEWVSLRFPSLSDDPNVTLRDTDIFELFVAPKHALAIIDTRTHVAIAREPSEEMVERVARALCMWDRDSDYPCKKTCPACSAEARAAIAALVAVQTQGGEREGV